MTPRLTPSRRRASRAVWVRPAQRGSAARGVIVVVGLVAALALQLAGPRLQCHLADVVGTPGAAPAVAPASMPSCGSSSDASSMHPCKVATATTGNAPVI